MFSPQIRRRRRLSKGAISVILKLFNTTKCFITSKYFHSVFSSARALSGFVAFEVSHPENVCNFSSFLCNRLVYPWAVMNVNETKKKKDLMPEKT